MAVCGALCLLAGTAYARVYARWRMGQGAAAFIAAGGKQVYSAPVIINDGKGQLGIFAYNRRLEAVMAELGRVFSGSLFSADGAAVSAVWEAEGSSTRVLALQPSKDRDQTLVFAFEQSAADAGTSGSRPRAHRLKAVPPYPSSEPVFFAQNEETGTSLAVSRTSAGIEAVRQFYDSQLRAAGWGVWPSQAPGGRSGGTSCNAGTLPFAAYFRGREICWLLVDSPEPAGARIILLHKALR